MIGHRGAAAAAPENTLASLRKAHELGARWVEFDVKLTRDGYPILAHDDRLERTTDGRGRFAAATLAEIAAARCRQLVRAGASRASAVPTFEQALALCRALGLGINVEIKPCRGREIETARVAVETLLAHWPATLPAPLISSFVPACLGVAREIAPAVPRGYLAGAPAAALAGAARRLRLQHAASRPAPARRPPARGGGGGRRAAAALHRQRSGAARAQLSQRRHRGLHRSGRRGRWRLWTSRAVASSGASGRPGGPAP